MEDKRKVREHRARKWFAKVVESLAVVTGRRNPDDTHRLLDALEDRELSVVQSEMTFNQRNLYLVARALDQRASNDRLRTVVAAAGALRDVGAHITRRDVMLVTRRLMEDCDEADDVIDATEVQFHDAITKRDPETGFFPAEHLPYVFEDR